MTPILIDARNVDIMLPQLLPEMAGASFIGLDCETQDDNRHEGLNAYCGYDPETRKKSKQKALVFDMRRTVMTGFSVHVEGSEFAYYLNMNHADVANRLPEQVVHDVISARPAGSHFLAHNAPYELAAFDSCYGIKLTDIICTLQMAVSAYGPDEYDPRDFRNARAGAFGPLIPEIMKLACAGGFDPEKGEIVDSRLSEVVYSIIGKQSKAAHSYNGFVSSVAYGYSLKKAVKSWFSYDMETFDEVLGENAHTGQLTGDQIVSYGADDAYWAVRLFRRLLQFMAEHCPSAIKAFLEQENPMIHLYKDMWMTGMRVNMPAILSRRDLERVEAADVMRKIKADVVQLLPFQDEPHEGLAKRDSWYQKGAGKYRQQVVTWANSPDHDDPYQQVAQVRGAVTNAWRAEEGDPESKGINLAHYMPQRILFYDLTNTKVVVAQNKTQSDAEARGKLIDRFKAAGDTVSANMLQGIGDLAGIEQRMKLYLTPYSQLMDPETGRLYPSVNSMLASRRMAASTPNPMQLAKRGTSTYVRGFFLGDNDDHLVLSRDWSAIELVIIGELSGDPMFLQAFGQIPHEDMHTGAAADVLAADVEGLNETIFKGLKRHDTTASFLDEFADQLGNTTRLFTNLKGETLDPGKASKYWRTEVGKGANFNYWYSGWLATIGERMGWSMEKTKLATERYRDRFSVAEQWRVDLIAELATNGQIFLPDGHRRTRYEATTPWLIDFKGKFDFGNDADLSAYNALVHWIAKKIQKRAYNQGVNSMVQGTCATLAKRTALRVMVRMKEMGWDSRIMRLMVPIHDELVFSVHKNHVLEAVHMLGDCMNDHPDLISKCKIDSSPAIGVTFEPYDPIRAPFGQIELFEAPKLPGVLPESTHNKRLNDDQILSVVDYLTHQKMKMAA